MNKPTSNPPIGPFTNAFLDLHIMDFDTAKSYVHHLPYGRNADKADPLCVLKDGRGTCSTKHELIYRLSQEWHVSDCHLELCIFAMHAQNTPKLAQHLAQHQLKSIPEAHIYLREAGQIVDITFPGKSFQLSADDILFTAPISVDDLHSTKTAIHRAFMAQWLIDEQVSHLSLDDLWRIREQAIALL